MNNKLNLLLIALLAGVSLSACSNAKQSLGLTRASPDEFAVVKRAPLEMPPDYALRPPRPGAPRPQEQGMNEQARATVFGSDTGARKAAPASGESALLQAAGATNANASIRNVVDHETAMESPEKKPVAERLFGIKRGDAESEGVLNAEEEAARLKAQYSAQTPVVKK